MSIDIHAEMHHAEFRDKLIEFLAYLDEVLVEPQENYSDDELIDFVINRLREYK